MKLRAPATLLALIPALAACTLDRQVNFPAEPVTLADLVQEVKHEIGAYALWEGDGAPLGTVCTGQLQIRITKVAITVATATSRGNSGEASAELPLDIVSITPNAKFSKEVSGSQTLAFTIYPEPSGGGDPADFAPPSARFATRPILDSLKTLRSALLAASQHRPCVRFGTPEKSENKLTYGFKIQESRTLGGKVKLLIFSLGSDNKASDSVENTIAIHFTMTGEAFMP